MSKSLKKVLWVAVGFQLLAVSWVSAAWQESIYGPPWCRVSDTSIWNPCSLPLNVSDIFQTKTGNLFINNDLTARRLIVPGNPGQGAKVMIGDDAMNNPDGTAILDVDGQIRIRGGNFGAGTPAGKVLTSVDSTGLAQWKSLSSIISISQSTVNPGIILDPNPIIADGTVGVDASYIQRRVRVDETGTGSCQSGKTIVSIDLDGRAVCLPATISLTAGAGLSASPADPITNTGTINVNVGGGLNIVSDQLRVNAGNGLEVNGDYLQFSPCSTACPYLITKFGIWHCSPPPGSNVACI